MDGWLRRQTEASVPIEAKRTRICRRRESLSSGLSATMISSLEVDSSPEHVQVLIGTEKVKLEVGRRLIGVLGAAFFDN